MKEAVFKEGLSYPLFTGCISYQYKVPGLLKGEMFVLTPVYEHPPLLGHFLVFKPVF